MLTTEEATARVARGAAHLDRGKPGWFKTIDLGTLDLSRADQCVVGQLFGCYSQFRALGISDTDGASGLGFTANFDEGAARRKNFGRLQDAWIAAIADRRLASGDNQPTEQPDDKRGVTSDGTRLDFLFAHD